MNLIKLVTGKPTENTYIVSENGTDAVIIDPGDDIKLIVDTLEENAIADVCVVELIAVAVADFVADVVAFEAIGFNVVIGMYPKFPA